MKKVLSLIIFMIIAFVGFMSVSFQFFAHAEEEMISKQLKENALANNQAYINSFSQSEKYYTVHQRWVEENVAIGKDHIIITPNEFTGGNVNVAENSEGYNQDTVFLGPNEEISFTVNIDTPGLYQVFYDYYVINSTRVTPQLAIFINDEIQYNEMNNLFIPVNWEQEETNYYDRYGDQLSKKSHLKQEWKYEQGLYDPNYFFIEPLKFNLTSGLNKITIRMNEGSILLGNIEIKNKVIEIPSYEDYYQSFTENTSQSKTLIQIEAEELTYKSTQSIRSKYMRDPQITPYEYKNRVLNVLDGQSFASGGDFVSYTFYVEEDGFYNLAFKYYINGNDGIPSHRTISINGEVPFQELMHYPFTYNTGWTNEVIPFKVYLTNGYHTLTLKNDNVKVRDVYHRLITVLNDIQQIGNQITKLTGGLTDRERNWKITTYIPNLKQDLQSISDRIELSIQELKAYAKRNDIPAITQLEIAKKQIDSFIKDPDSLPGFMSRFNQGDSSSYGRINVVIPSLIYSPLHLDSIYVYHETNLPHANANIFVQIWEGIKAFFYSFFDPKYNETSLIDDHTIEIWVNKSRLYVEIMQRMIDEEFTPKTGIKVQLSIMPDENKLILSNAAGTTPDGVIGVSHDKPFELALRGVTEDLTKYPGFYDLSEEFNPSTFIPYIYDRGVYGLPETQDVKLLFYRTDIFNNLGIEPPQTWEDVISLIPVLQKYNMNFYTPLGNDASFKGFDATSPFIYQHGGVLYNEETMTTTINKDGAYKAFQMMTNLYSIYNLPITSSNFYQHFRTGILPIGISDANMYIQLKYAAPELAGQWAILPIPGIRNEEGVVERWDPTYGTSSIIFKTSEKKEATWELLKWWASSVTQREFSYEIQSTLGNKFLYMSANLEGFAEGAWPSDSKNIILEQWQWIQATGKVPGDYMLERELSNAWNKVIFDGVHQRIAIDNAVIIINREIERKLQEFGYMDEDGNIIKEYHITTIENVESVVRK